MITLGVMANKEELGLEASGIVRRCGPGVKHFKPGDRVMMMNPGLLRTRVVLPAHRCQLLPPSLSLEDAASMLVVYATVLYCLIDIGKLEKGQVRKRHLEKHSGFLTFTVCFNPCGLWRGWYCCDAGLPDAWSKGKQRLKYL